ncbi:MAG: Crp/Fnr family transcriptional regulator [Flavobacteriales bacterium]
MELKSLLQNEFDLQLESELLSEIAHCGELKTIAPQTTMMEIGQEISMIPLLLAGSIKIFTQDENGEELLLYYLEPGDTCAMTLKCCTGKKKSNISAVTDEETTIIFIPVQKMDEWMVKYSSWRNFVLDSHHIRMQELLEAVDSLAFMNMEERLSKYLKDKVLVSKNPEIHITHAEIARDLHSSRVVISRLMKKLEKNGSVVQRRNMVSLPEYDT